MTIDNSAPLPEGMETTGSERENWRNAAKQDGGDFGYGGALTIGRHWFLRLLRDFDRQSAEIARLTADRAAVPPDREKAAIELVFQAKCLSGSLYENTRAAMHAAALLLRSPADGWRLIESAPKMKTILLWAITDTDTRNWKMATGFWSTGHEAWVWDGHTLEPYETQPTHWYDDLPSPPAEEKTA